MTLGIVKSASKAIEAVKRMRAGMQSTTKKRAKHEVSRLFGRDKKKKKQVAWRHKFFCLAYKDQEKIPTTDMEKEELYQAGLGEKVVEFETLNLSQSQFRSIIIDNFPRLKDGGGFQFLKGWQKIYH